MHSVLTQSVRIYSVILLTILYVNFIHAQNEKNNWFFGQNAGLAFTGGSPPINQTGALQTFEGCASISDASGQILFYTDGSTVYNPNSVVMTNGTGLLGNPSSTSSAIIVPVPCACLEYYIFTVDFVNGSNGVNYSIVDMDDNGNCVYDLGVDFGQVTATKNINLAGPTGEKITAVLHKNGTDYWVIATQQNTNNFYVYEVTQAGVSLNAIQSVGPILSAGFYMKASPDGDQLAVSSNTRLHTYDFDNITGIISNPRTTGGNYPQRVYGLEYSPDGQHLFFSEVGFAGGTVANIYHKDLNSSANPSVIGIVTNASPGYPAGALQMSPDNGTIYIAQDRRNMLSSITPNPDWSSPLFTLNAFATTNQVRLGLPTFISGQVNTACTNMQGIRRAVPTLFSPAVEAELGTDRFTPYDKEYGDIDNDGDVDILYTKSQQLHALINTAGAGNTPTFSVPGTSLGIQSCLSYRLYDWDGINGNDLIVHGTSTSSVNGTFVYLNNGSGGFPAVPNYTLLASPADFPWNTNNQQVINISDLNNDGKADILISDQSGVIFGTVYFEQTSASTPTAPSFILATTQNYGGTNGAISNPFLPDASGGGSYNIPEIYDVDCNGTLDILNSSPLFNFTDGGRIYFHENFGTTTSGTLPDVNVTGVPNQFGFNDQLNSDDLRCDFVVTRMVDWYGDGCPIAIAYNPCEDKFFFYEQECPCVAGSRPLCTTNELQIQPSSGAIGDEFGRTVDIDDYRVVVGSRLDDQNGADAGAVYVYEWDGTTWNETKLLASDGASGDIFGSDVSIAGDKILVGAPGDDDNGFDSGSVYLYEWNGTTWVETKFTSSDGQTGDGFGSSVSLNASFANAFVVGTPYDDDMGLQSGSMYRFEFTLGSWQERKFTASDGAVGDFFGIEIAYEGGKIVVGAEGDDDNGNSSGSAYVFTRTGSNSWSETKLIASDGQAADNYGRFLDVEGDRIIISATEKDDGGLSNSGSLYIYDLSGGSWIETRLIPSDAAVNNRFGFGVHLDGNRMIIGGQESAYVYELMSGSWQNETKIEASNGLPFDFYGIPAITDEYIVVGAYGKESIYIYDCLWKGLDDLAAYFRVAPQECPTSLYVSNASNQITYRAGTVSSDATIFSGNTNRMSANNLVLLQAGFHAENGSNFIAKIEGCPTVEESQAPSEEIITASTDATSDEFGYATDIDGGRFVVGARFDDDGGTDTGNVFIYDWNSGTTTWDETKLQASDSRDGDSYGTAVAVSGDRVVVGALLDDDNGTNSGAVYVYEWNGSTWDETKLMASDAAAFDQFGGAVDIDEDLIIIGAQNNDDNAPNSGSAYIFEWNSGTASWEETKLLASDGTQGDNLGVKVAINGDRAVVGSRGRDDNGSNSGAVYIYDWNSGTSTWDETKLLASDGASNDFFGTAVDVDGDRIVVGAYGDDDNGATSGAIYIYDWNSSTSSWDETKIVSTNGSTDDFFGFSVSLDADEIAVGAYGDEGRVGGAYLLKFDGTNWVEEKYEAFDKNLTEADDYGFSVSLSGNRLVVGARFGEDLVTDAGAVYVYDSVNFDCCDDDLPVNEDVVELRNEDQKRISQKMTLSNFPNPFRNNTNITFTLPIEGAATIEVFDTNGKVVYTQTNDYTAGEHQLEVNTANQLNAGVYYYRLSTGEETMTKTMMILE